MKLMIRDKIVSLSTVACLLPIVVMIIMIAIQKNNAQEQVGEEIDKLARDEIAQISEDVFLMCEALNEVIDVNDPAAIKKAQQQAHDKIASITVGKSGYVYVLGGTGDDRGHYIVSKDGIRDGEDIWNAQDSEGRLFIQSMVNKAVRLQPGQIDYERYPWQNKGETKHRYKFSALTYFEPWDWVTGAGTYEDDFYAAKDKIAGALDQLLLGSIVSGFLLVIVSILVAVFLSKRIVNPIKGIRDIAREIAQGNFTTEITIETDDEVGDLADAFREMSDNLSAKAKIAENFAAGNLNVDIEVLHSEDALSKSMIEVRESLISLTTEVSDLTVAAIRGDLHTRADAEKYQGEYRRIVNGLNRTIDTLVKHLDSVPTPVVILDIEYNIKFMNRAACDLGDNVTFERLYNSKCYDFFKTDDCKNGNCACNKAMKSNELVRGSTRAKPNGRVMDISYVGTPIVDENGVIIGAMDAVVDQTDILKAQRRFEKISLYQSKEVETLNRLLDQMADGDLTITYQPADSDEDTAEIADSFMEISESLNESLDNLNNILSSVTIAVDQVSTGAQQVSSASQSLSEGSTEQASSIEETSASMEEIGSQTRQNAENAEKANELTAVAQSAAESGNQSMQRMIEAMAEIKTSSGEVSKIIKVIDEIAFQTNLLSLNAAVEAARAGIHGKGFAVVADEVRNLAQRSAKAAKETTQMIEDSMSRVLAGSDIALKTGEALGEIVSSTSKATSLVNEIADASREQANGIEQINDALTQIDAVTQSNTANAEESAAAAEELSSQALQLADTVRKFKLRNLNIQNSQLTNQKTTSPNANKQGISRIEGRSSSGNGNKSRLPLPEQIIALDDDEFGDF